ncbi:PTS sugar transporter subunit IIA [Polyangium spumosum]|uniref:Nitrogen regulatory IIA protein n=1 Tax=Polyangium spumosum TaxID=889282 RepID=A0A6N7PTY3_9BACT|nr:PTS sugar transporter subunit IIA [Polyangium spumosum]MRG92271.1 nitrogen regulatory IIA protein [Polyangium spumosum]
MGVLEILSADHVSVANEAEGVVRSKSDALRRLAELLARGMAPPTPASEIERVLVERENLQSTGVGGGVAIPHGALEGLDRHVGAVLLCPHPIDFDAIDRAPVGILFAVVGPKRAAGEHLKTLARVSRLLRDDEFRKRLLLAPSGGDAFAIIAAEEGRGP